MKLCYDNWVASFRFRKWTLDTRIACLRRPVACHHLPGSSIGWNCLILKIIIKSPRFYRGTFMFLYRFVHCRHGPQILVHAITFEQLFQFLSFLAQLLALIYRLPDYILVDFLHDLDLEFSRSHMEFAISQPKMVQLPGNKKQTHRLNSRPQIWP